jgi:hypothetical protein
VIIPQYSKIKMWGRGRKMDSEIKKRERERETKKRPVFYQSFFSRLDNSRGT